MHSDYRGMRSTAAIFGHPIHPMLVVFPIGFLVGAHATDLAFWGTSDPFWARASEWLLGAGIVMGALAAVAGLIEFVTISRVRSLVAGWVHFLGNATAILLSVWNLLHRLGGDPRADILFSIQSSMTFCSLRSVRKGMRCCSVSFRHWQGLAWIPGRRRPD